MTIDKANEQARFIARNNGGKILRADYALNYPAAESERRRREDECAARKPAISPNNQI